MASSTMLWLLRRQLQSSDAAVRRKAAEQLCQSPSPRALPALSAALGDSDPEVRRLAASGLAKLEVPERFEPLTRALRDSSPEVLKAALPGIKGATDQKITASLPPLLRHGDAGVRGRAAQLLESGGWRPATREEELWYLVAKGQFARAASFGAAALPALELALLSSPYSLGVAIVEALGQINDPRVLRPLLHALKVSDPGICIMAVESLTRLGVPETIEPLMNLLRHSHPQVRVAAAEALGRLRASAASEQVRALLRDPIWEVRREAAETLGKLNDAGAVEPLAHALSDADADVREAAAIALGNLNDRRAIGPLVLALKDTNSGVRRIATASLTRIEPHWHTSPEARAVLAELQTALQSDDLGVRHFVGQLLTSLGPAEAQVESPPALPPEESTVGAEAKRQKLAVSLLVTILCDHDRDLRQAAAEALGRLKDERARGALLQARNDPDAGVSAAVAAALQHV